MSRITPVQCDERLSTCVGTGDTVVDCGCGTGDLLRSLGGRFRRYVGLEISERRLAQANTVGLELRQADLNGTFPLPDNFADAVIANQVIEHIVDPIHFVTEIHRVLKTGGRYFVTTPNIRYIKSVLRLIFSGYGPRTAGGNTRDGGWDDGHLHYFTHRDLRELFRHAGCREVHSSALINLNRSGTIRHIINSGAESYLIREFLSGNILLYGIK